MSASLWHGRYRCWVSAFAAVPPTRIVKDVVECLFVTSTVRVWNTTIFLHYMSMAGHSPNMLEQARATIILPPSRCSSANENSLPLIDCNEPAQLALGGVDVKAVDQAGLELALLGRPPSHSGQLADAVLPKAAVTASFSRLRQNAGTGLGRCGRRSYRRCGPTPAAKAPGPLRRIPAEPPLHHDRRHQDRQTP